MSSLAGTAQDSGRVPIQGPLPVSFTTIYHAHCNYVWHSLRRLGVADRDLEDCVHDVFMVVHRRLDDYDPTRPIKPWLFGISLRVAKDYRNRARNRREIVHDEVPEPGEAQDGPAEALESKRARATVAAALESLDWKHRTVLVMHDINGHTMGEIADVLDVSSNTLYSRLRTARQRFESTVRRQSLVGGMA